MQVWLKGSCTIAFTSTAALRAIEPAYRRARWIPDLLERAQTSRSKCINGLGVVKAPDFAKTSGFRQYCIAARSRVRQRRERTPALTAGVRPALHDVSGGDRPVGIAPNRSPGQGDRLGSLACRRMSPRARRTLIAAGKASGPAGN
jgi:hypothetical protein